MSKDPVYVEYVPQYKLDGMIDDPESNPPFFPYQETFTPSPCQPVEGPELE